MQGPLKLLISSPVRAQVQVARIDCGEQLCLRLSELGLHVGAIISVLKNDSRGPLILRVLQSKLILGRGEAAKIYVTQTI